MLSRTVPGRKKEPRRR